MKTLLVPLALMTLLLPAQAGAAPHVEDFDAIDELTALMASSVGRQAVPIDRRIRLGRCPEAVSVDFADKDSLVVRCSSINWRLRVPLVTSSAGTQTGGLAKAPLAPVIRRGDTVRLEIKTEAFTVGYSAIAADDAAVGQPVRLRTLDTRFPLRAVATAPGRARLDD